MRIPCLSLFLIVITLISCSKNSHGPSQQARSFNGAYTGENLNRVAFPIGGIGAGMLCLDGNGAFSHLSVRNRPDVFNTPFMFAALSVKGIQDGARILEGPVQSWKIFGNPMTGNGMSVFGCPRFEKASFETRFPFATVGLTDRGMPVDVSIEGWSPFIPGDADNSSLPVGGLEYTFKNTGGKELEAVFSFHAENFMRASVPSEWGNQFFGKDSILQMDHGFVLKQKCSPDKPHFEGDFAIFTDEPETSVDYCWFRGGWFDGRTLLWNNISNCNTPANPASTGASGASVYIPVAEGVKVHHLQYGRSIRLGIDDLDQILELQAMFSGNCPGRIPLLNLVKTAQV